jgi:hypothetical protein
VRTVAKNEKSGEIDGEIMIAEKAPRTLTSACSDRLWGFCRHVM